MVPIKSRSFGKWILLLLVSLPLIGCEFDPSRSVHSETPPPDRQTDDGVRWCAERVANTSDEWFYAPYEAVCASGFRPVPTDTNIDVLLSNGKIYRITKTPTGYSFVGIVDQDIAANPGLVFVAFILFVAVVVSLGVAGHVAFSLNSTTADLSNVNGELAAAKAEARRHESVAKATLKKSEEDKQRAEKQRAAEEQAMKAAREELERQQKAVAVAAKSPKLTIEKLTKENYLNVSQAIRHQLFNGNAASREVSVKWILDPCKSKGALWACVFEWETLLDRPVTLRVAVLRDGKLIHREAGSFRGTFGTFLAVGKRHKFTWKVYDGKRQFDEPLLHEVVAPPFEAWTAEPPKPPEPKSDEELRRERDAWTRNEYQIIDEKIDDPELRKAKKAQIDQEAAVKFGEAK